jgi:hypothetical protein
MSCNHALKDKVVTAGPTSSNKGLILDFWCMHCETAGSIGVEPEELEWDPPPAVPRIFIHHPNGSFECEDCMKISGSYKTAGDQEVNTWEEYSHGWSAPCVCKTCGLAIPVYVTSDARMEVLRLLVEQPTDHRSKT